MADHHVAPALGAEFVDRNVGNFLALIEAARGLAIGIAGAGHELAEASALQHHHPAAVLAIFFLRGLLNVRRIQVGQVDRIFLGEGAAFGILLVVRAAGVERPVLAPLDHQRRAAALALLVRGLLHPLDVLHMLFGISEILGEALVEFGEGISPGFLALFDLVELFFEARGVLDVENVAEVFHQQIGDDQSDFGGRELAAQLLHVLRAPEWC